MTTQTPKLRFPEFSDNWEVKKVEDFAPLQRGFDLPVDNIIKGEYPVVFSNGILKSHIEYKAKAPGVVTGRSGTIGKVTFVEKDYWPHNTALWVTNFKGNYPKYVYYFYHNFNLERFSTGSGVPTLNRNDVHIQKIAIPQLPEQTKIANFLTAIDEKIQALKQKKTLLEQYKKGIMQQIFSQELRFKNDDGSDFDDWEEKSLGDVVELFSGFPFSGDAFGGYGFKVVTPKNFTKTGRPIFTTENTKLTTQKVEDKYICKKGDLLVLLTDLTQTCELLGKPIYLFEDEEYLLNQRIVRVEFNNSKLSKQFLLYVLLTDKYHKYIKETASGSTVRHSSNKIILNAVIPLPSLPEQQKIANFLTAIDEKIEKVSQQITATETYKKGLLQQMFI